MEKENSIDYPKLARSTNETMKKLLNSLREKVQYASCNTIFDGFDWIHIRLQKVQEGGECLDNNTLINYFSELTFILFSFLRSEGYSIYDSKNFDPELLQIAKELGNLIPDIEVISGFEAQNKKDVEDIDKDANEENEKKDLEIDSLKFQLMQFKRAVLIITILAAASISANIYYISTKIKDLRTANAELNFKLQYCDKQKILFHTLLKSNAKPDDKTSVRHEIKAMD